MPKAEKCILSLEGEVVFWEKDTDGDHVAVQSFKPETMYIDENGNLHIYVPDEEEN